MKFPYILLIVGLMVFSFSACKTSRTTDPDAGMTWDIVHEGPYGGVEEAANLLIKDSDTWTDLWADVMSNRRPTPEIPEVDFNTHYLVACFMGMRTNGGYTIKIGSMDLSEGNLQVGLIYEGPGKLCMVTDALTYPYVIARVSKENVSEASFEAESVTRDCD